MFRPAIWCAQHPKAGRLGVIPFVPEISSQCFYLIKKIRKKVETHNTTIFNSHYFSVHNKFRKVVTTVGSSNFDIVLVVRFTNFSINNSDTR